MNTTLRGGVVVLPDSVVRGPLCIVGDRVADAAPNSYEIDLRDHLIFPGLINAHDHLGLNNIPALPKHEPFPNSYAWAAALQPHLDIPACATALAFGNDCRLWQGGFKNLLCGATTVAHHDPWHATFDDPSFPVNLLRRFGWCHSLGLAPPDERSRPAYAHGIDTVVSLAVRGFARLLPHLPGGLRSRRLGPYGPAAVASFAATPSDRPWMIHLAEGTDAEASDELRQLKTLGCLAANTVIVHGVALATVDIQQVIERGAAVVWCPASNLSLLGKTIDPRQLFDAGRLALGTDSRLSGSRDLLDELRVAAGASDLGPVELLRLATSDAARVLAMPQIGGLAPGQHADMMIVRDSGGDPYQILLNLQRGDIRAVVRNGVPQIADIDFGEWFAAHRLETARVDLDHRPKLLRRSLARPDAIALEPGLTCA